MTTAETKINRVLIVDDDRLSADIMSELVLDAGFEPVIYTHGFDDISVLLNTVREEADAAICDHRLSYKQPAHFNGAEAVAEMFQSKIPALLVTQYINTDAHLSIRRWRRQVPVLLSRDEADPDRIREGLGGCAKEIQGQYLPGRRPWRTLIEAERISDEAGEKVVEARVFAWNPYRVVRFPLSLIPPELQDHLVPGTFLFAMVNIGSKHEEDLYFFDFEPAPEPVTEESLG